jgi:hypothetical protein
MEYELNYTPKAIAVIINEERSGGGAASELPSMVT